MLNRVGPFNSVLPSQVRPAQALSGNGSPEGVVPGNPGQTFIDLVTNNLWLKIRGSQTKGWQLVGVWSGTSGGGTVVGGTQIFTWDGVGDKPAASGVALLIGTVGSAVDGQMWKKTSSSTSNTDWVAV